ncbi:hypothetical protein NDU88_003545 [Pleurodeles waltl]|uniref:Uncharacterized protein n=1 Tax=Pleurodeles waltl TaxID=8319 RepID=A0AAV7TRF5_PLEWA|nr:hypothetical protein NDU88_003545 [Pleurodeles waltl]
MLLVNLVVPPQDLAGLPNSGEKVVTSQCPRGTHPCADCPGVPVDDDRLDPEVLLGTADRMADVAPSGFLKKNTPSFQEGPPAQEDVSRRPADANKEEDHGQQKPRDARNQEGARAEAGHALESVATPSTGSV